MPEVASQTLAEAPSLQVLNGLLDPLSMRAGWNKHEPSLWPAPRTAFVPASWTYANARAALDSAGRLINTAQAERRNLFLVNPVEGNYYSTLRTLVSAYQMILPGEKARTHRHTPHALRLVLDVEDKCYTVVDGTRIDMLPGDVLLTPGWAWHGHGNDGKRPGYWIDFLDVPLVQLLEPMFLEDFPQGFQSPEATTRNSSYVFPWSETERLLAKAEPDEFGRRRTELGSPALPTISLVMERLQRGRHRPTLRTTANQIVAIVSGQGRTLVDGAEIAWQRGDVMALPTWKPFHHESDEAVIFTVSDEPVHRALGYLRTEAS